MKNNILHSLMSPKRGMAYGVLVVASLVMSLLFSVSIGFVAIFVFGMMIVSFFIGMFLASIIIYFAARLVKVAGLTFYKAMVFAAISSLILNALSLLSTFAHVPTILFFILNLVITVGLIRWYFKISIPKAIGVLAVELLIMFVLVAVMFFTVGFSLISSMMGNRALNDMPPAQNTYMYDKADYPQDFSDNKFQ